MKHLLSLLLIYLGTLECKGEVLSIDTAKKFTLISLPKFYKEKGIIFDESYAIGIEVREIKNRYTPTIGDILIAESIFYKKYPLTLSEGKNTKSYFKRWVRQYVGLMDVYGHKNIVIQLIDNRKPKSINRLLGKGWEVDFVIMLSDSLYKVSKRFRINIQTGEMSDQL